MMIKEIINVPVNEDLNERLKYYEKVNTWPKHSNYKLPQFKHKPNPNRLPRDDY